MEYKTNFFKKLLTSIYDIKVFSKYAKEGIFTSISYSMLLTLILFSIKGIFKLNKTDDFSIILLIDTISLSFGKAFLNLLINCLIVSTLSSIFAIFMRMIVKYKDLYSLTLYAATLPFIIQFTFETFNPNINFDNIFIIGTLTYVLLTLKYIKEELIKNIT